MFEYIYNLIFLCVYWMVAIVSLGFISRSLFYLYKSEINSKYLDSKFFNFGVHMIAIGYILLSLRRSYVSIRVDSIIGDMQNIFF